VLQEPIPNRKGALRGEESFLRVATMKQIPPRVTTPAAHQPLH